MFRQTRTSPRRLLSQVTATSERDKPAFALTKASATSSGLTVIGLSNSINSAGILTTARALRTLTDEQREALILVGAGGFSYEEAAAICRCAVGTVKSRVARPRKALIAILEGEEALPAQTRPDQGDAARDIMAQLDRIAPERKETNGERSGEDTNEFGHPIRRDKRSSS